jgi:hypothetical protein
MRVSIFFCAGLLLIGSISISECYPNSNEDAATMLLNLFNTRSDASEESFESPASSRSYKWGEERRDMKLRKRTCTGGCTPACKADQLCIAPNLCVCPNGHAISPCPIQSSGLCAPADTANVKPVVSITFGQGTQKYSSATPASLGFHTSYPQLSNKKVTDGNFAIVNEVPADFSTWLAGGLDHTKGCTGGATKGYMMLVNAAIAPGSEILSAQANNLCIGLRYQFSFYIANVIKSGTNIIKPNIQLQVRTATGAKTLLATESTGDVLEQSPLTWVKYGLSFVTPASSVTLSLISNAPGGSGDDFAIDDVSLVSCSPSNNGVCHA